MSPTVTTEDLPALDELDVIGPDTYMLNGYPFDAWKRLRKESPIHWFDVPGGVGFWAVTRREDLVWISKQPDLFQNGPRLAVFEEGAPVEGERKFVRQLLNMDPPEHAEYRGTASSWFTPRSIARKNDEVRRIARELLSEMAGDGEEREGDFCSRSGGSAHSRRTCRHVRRPSRRLAENVRVDEPCGWFSGSRISSRCPGCVADTLCFDRTDTE